MTNKLLEHALQQHQQGKLKEALESYQKVLREEPEQIDALHGLGIVLSQLGSSERSIAMSGSSHSSFT